jgi:uncharacterized protein (TIGR03067 family)
VRVAGLIASGLLVGAALAGPRAAAGGEPGVLGHLPGPWSVASATMNGRERTDATLLLMAWTFRGSELILESPRKGRARFALAVEPGSDPAALRLTRLEGADAPASGWMLVSLARSQPSLAFNDNLEGRPAGFQPAPTARPKVIVVTLALARDSSRRAGLSPAPRDLCGLLRAAGAGDLLGTPAAPCQQRERQDGDGVVALEAGVGPAGVGGQRAGGSVSLVVVAVPHPVMGTRWFERERARARAAAGYQEEPAVGPSAFSIAPPGISGLRVVAFKGDTSVSLDVVAPGGDAARLRRFALNVLASF